MIRPASQTPFSALALAVLALDLDLRDPLTAGEEERDLTRLAATNPIVLLWGYAAVGTS